MGFKEIAQDVVKYLGGKENISSVAHCATRLRVMVKDEARVEESTHYLVGIFDGFLINFGFVFDHNT